MSIVFDRPYEFIEPYKKTLWPTIIQKFRLYDYYLRRKEGVVDYRCEGLHHFRDAVQSGDGILLAPNHCRYADPLVLGWPARECGTHLHALASWHLFNRGAFDTFAIRRMGAFSLNREGSDRRSLDAAIEILVEARRPLIVFPEGATYRTNDVLKPLMEGTSFIARAAARRAAKVDRRVVVLPACMKYLCVDPVTPWADRQLSHLEKHLGWSVRSDDELVPRTTRIVEALLAGKEVEYESRDRSGTMPQRRDRLIEYLLDVCEQRLSLVAKDDRDVAARLVAIRTSIVSRYFGDDDSIEPTELRRLADTAESVLELRAFPDSYLTPGEVTDTRIVETIQRIQESLFGKADQSIRLSVVIRFDAPIPVPAKKTPRGETDPILVDLKNSLETMVHDMSGLAKPVG